ncbi:uncharacterized protein DUF3822 [Arcticibacter pallidicorallinus]|uniref:Uncharacterized protein DUF3822 n=1 Tax=Arcticibacter pallidicorallinus TaxID=1259464 RepID=A0A2T0U0N0_9SPHI|nr:DUF3822 family protein [Arcticibacter pallidicorallinus]PRY51459.1 uncharacterized protein DUF3822 [Arcticibacter pallidicorallinus]
MNNVGTLHLKDKNYLPEQAGSCELLIKHNKHKLSYAIRNIQSNELYVIYDASISGSMEEAFTGLTAQNEYLNQSFGQVKVSSETFNFVFIPTELYAESSSSSFKNFVQSTKPTRTCTNAMLDGKVQAVSAVEDSVVAPLKKKFSNAVVYSQAEAFIESALKGSANESGLRAFIQFNSGSFEMVIVSDGEFVFYNIFSFENADDFNYYLLLIKQQFELQPATPVLLAGEIEKYSELYKRIARYFQNIRFCDSTSIVKHPDSFKLLPSHQFFSLLSMSLCE